MSNRLNKVVTKTGDDGTTALADGERVEKSSLRMQAIGEIDELNSWLGVLAACSVPDDISNYLRYIQHSLFDVGGELAIPGNAVITHASSDGLEQLIASYNKELPALKEFILPGGSMSAAICYLARSVCRRAERTLVALGQDTHLNPETLSYINRLSDLLFVWSRSLNRLDGSDEVYWNSERLKRSV